MRIVAPVLRWKKIKTVDLMILSHPNSDHLNGLLYILEHFTVREVWDNGEAVSTAGYGQWRRLIAEKEDSADRFQNTAPPPDLRRGRVGDSLPTGRFSRTAP
jgi:competence protein ComEC